jgi:hypothetical protein
MPWAGHDQAGDGSSAGAKSETVTGSALMQKFARISTDH